MGLQGPRQDDADAVQGHLEREHAQEGGHERALGLGLGVGGHGEEACDRHAEGDQDEEHETEQPVDGAARALRLAARDGGRQERDSGGGQGSSDDDLVQDVGDLVGGRVGTGDAARTHRRSLHDPAQEAQQPRGQGQSGDTARGPRQAAPPGAGTGVGLPLW